MYRTLSLALPLALSFVLNHAHAHSAPPAKATPLETFAATALFGALLAGSAEAGDSELDKKVTRCLGAHDGAAMVDVVRNYQTRQFNGADRASLNAFLASGAGTKYAKNRLLTEMASDDTPAAAPVSGLLPLSPEEAGQVQEYLATPLGKRLDSDEVLGDAETVQAVVLRGMKLMVACLQS